MKNKAIDMKSIPINLFFWKTIKTTYSAAITFRKIKAIIAKEITCWNIFYSIA